MDLAAFGEALEAFVGGDPGCWGDTESIVALEGCLAQMECFVARAVACFDAAGNYAPEGARSAPAWLAARCHLPAEEAKDQLRLGRAMRQMPVAEEAFSKGAIGSAQVRLLSGLLQGSATREALEEGEGLLVDKAASLSFSSFQKVVAYFAQVADPDGTEERAEAMRARRDAYLVQGFDGSWLGRIQLDPIAGAIVAGELGRLEKAAFEAEWAEAKSRLGRAPRKEDLSRTAGQRRADALVEMARRSAGLTDDGHMPAPLVSVLVGYETLKGRICELANGTVVSPGSLLRYLEEALVERVVFAGPTRVEVGAKTRLFSGATRRAIELRDRVCQHPCCEVTADRCEVDHIVPAALGGLTTQENGRLLCGWHNRLRNRMAEGP